jgi:methionine aminopeptidase
MCTYVTQKIDIVGSGKGADGWFGLSAATVYVDHPVHAQFAHTVNIDFINPDRGAAARVAVELTEESALALIEAIRAALAAAPEGLASERQEAHAH